MTLAIRQRTYTVIII